MQSQWRIRPSAAARIVACPGSVRVSDGAPSWIDEYSDPTIRDEGTACHEFAAHKLLTGCSPAGQIASNGVACDTPMLDAIFMYENAIQALRMHKYWIERPLIVPGIPNCGGTPDVFGWQIELQADGTTRYLIDVCDLKYGFRIVPVWPNFQLAPYGVAACAELGLDISQVLFRFTIVQPRRWHPAGPVRQVRVTGEQVMALMQQISHAVALSDTPLAPLNTGEQCDYCPGRARCTGLQNRVTSVGFGDANDLTLGEAEQELKFLLGHKAAVEARITGLSAQVEHAITKKGARSNLFEMQSTSGKLEWKPDTVEQVRALATRLLHAEIEKKAELITPTQAIRLVGKDFVNTFAAKVPGARKLVLADPTKWAKRFES